jgi:hypothetical protein
MFSSGFDLDEQVDVNRLIDNISDLVHDLPDNTFEDSARFREQRVGQYTFFIDEDDRHIYITHPNRSELIDLLLFSESIIDTCNFWQELFYNAALIFSC